MKIHLGVIDVPEPEGGTSYTVAQGLEEDYNLFSVFWDYEQDNAIFALTESVSNALEQYMSTGNIPNDIFADATEEIDKDFRQFLDDSKVEKMGIPGVPTKAALHGKSIRLKREYGPRRPSFIDSGVLQSSFRSWVEK